MIPESPRLPETARYNHSEAARILGVDRKTLRTYAQRLGVKPYINLSGHTMWSGKQINGVWRRVMLG